MLDDQETYKHLKTNPTVFITKDVNKFVNNLLETKTITKEASFKLKNSNATSPRLYGLPNYTKKAFRYDQYFFYNLTYLRVS